jgi:hypothetical protein
VGFFLEDRIMPTPREQIVTRMKNGSWTWEKRQWEERSGDASFVLRLDHDNLELDGDDENILAVEIPLTPVNSANSPAPSPLSLRRWSKMRKDEQS